MKSLRFVLPLLLLGATVLGQGLTDIYRSGTVNLRPSADYGVGTKWEEILTGSDTDPGKPAVGGCSDIAVADDGSVFVANRNGNIVKLDNRGRLAKTFGGRGSSDGAFRAQPRIEGILDNRYVVVSEHNGRISLFDLNGQFARLVTVDYMPLGCVPLKNGKICILGHVPYGDGKVRLVVAIKDIESDEETIVSSRFQSMDDAQSIVVDHDTVHLMVDSPYTRLGACITRTPTGNLVVGWNDSLDVEVYAPDGEFVSSIKLQTKAVAITPTDKEEMTRNIKVAVDSAYAAIGRKIAHVDAVVKTPEKMPDHLPYFYKLMVDPENNLLVFTYSKKGESAEQIEAYNSSANGQYVSTATLKSADYDIGACLRGQSLAFHGGKLYGVATPKSAKDAIPRVVEFTLSK